MKRQRALLRADAFWLPPEVWAAVLARLGVYALYRGCATVCRQWLTLLPACVHVIGYQDVFPMPVTLVERFVALRHLDLSEVGATRHTNQSHHITDTCVSRLVSLTSLDLGFNWHITGASLRSLTNLSALDLLCNTVIGDADLAPLTQLTCLDLQDNECISGAALTCLTNLTSLHLCYNERIRDDDLAKMSALTALDLSITRGITGYGLRHLSRLTSLCLNYAVGDVDCRIIASLTQLRTLDVRQLGYSYFWWPRMTNLTALNICGNDGMRGCGDVCLRSLTNLTELHMCSTGVSGPALARLTNLRTLTLTLDELRLAASDLATLPRLQRIEVSDAHTEPSSRTLRLLARRLSHVTLHFHVGDI